MTKKLTKEQIDDIVGVGGKLSFYVFPDTTVTICLITLESGFSLVGKSACMDPEDFNRGLGQKWAFEDAKKQLWELEGYHRMATG